MIRGYLNTVLKTFHYNTEYVAKTIHFNLTNSINYFSHNFQLVIVVQTAPNPNCQIEMEWKLKRLFNIEHSIYTVLPYELIITYKRKNSENFLINAESFYPFNLFRILINAGSFYFINLF